MRGDRCSYMGRCSKTVRSAVVDERRRSKDDRKNDAAPVMSASICLTTDADVNVGPLNLIIPTFKLIGVIS